MVKWSEDQLEILKSVSEDDQAVNYANRGQDLEDMIETSNERYKFEGKALVQKIPEPIRQISDIQQGGRFTAIYEKKSTVDYIGTYKGYALAFDAKSTKVETRFDLSNVAKHQYEFMKNWHDNGGISFLVVLFKSHGEIYYLPFETLRYWQEEADRKSIPYESFQYEIEANGLVQVDYLSVVDDLEVEK